MTALLSGLAFSTPFALAGLLALPIIWWLLRFTPPKPQQIKFPPFRLLLDLINREEQPQHTPWWVLLMRMAMAAAIILAVAGPLLNASDVRDRSSDPLLIVVDDGWAAAPDWQDRQNLMRMLLSEAQRAGATASVVGTTGSAMAHEIALGDANTAAEHATALAPKAQTPDRASTLGKLTSSFADVANLRVLWLSDGLAHANDGNFTEELGKLANSTARVEVLLPEASSIPVAVQRPVLEASKLTLGAVRVNDTDATSALAQVRAINGRILAEAPMEFTVGQTETSATLELPLELRNEAAHIELANSRSAAGVYLFDDRWRRKSVAILSGASQELKQPLLSPLYYVERALQPSAEISEIPSMNDIQTALEAGSSMLVLADIGVLGESNVTALNTWVENGGVVVRFAGPRLSGGHDGLVPVELRSGGRTLGSALSWEQPQGLAPFSDGTPFVGLANDKDVKVTRQVLAEPSATLPGLVWASLEDGTPLVTAKTQGKGLVVLFHVTANADWSNLPLTGLFVEMLKRIADIAPAAGALASAEVPNAASNASAASIAEGAFTPVRTLNGYGELTAPP
ncbi:MAG: BatA domain-containing protein, partial [Anderseniella sp.]